MTESLADALRRALNRGRRIEPPDHDLETAVRRAFRLTPDDTPAPAEQSLAHQDTALADRLGAEIHTPDHH